MRKEFNPTPMNSYEIGRLVDPKTAPLPTPEEKTQELEEMAEYITKCTGIKSKTLRTPGVGVSIMPEKLVIIPQED